MKKFIISIILLLIITSMFTGYVSAAAKYKDIKDSDWFAEAIGKLSALKIIDGLPDGSFNPQGQVTRAEFVKMLVQAMEYKKIDSISF
ncbi:MAG TPA: S-layer homology domain-containing protein, partial [Bacillota bacterium]|nr:S-layer homology domain-containing protein [Bacillota bacterium]